jgi:O-antigen/teichoic acid export membrane protein
MQWLAKVTYNMGAAISARFLVGVVGVVIIGFLTRYLGPAGFGQYDAVLAYAFIFVAFADLGLYSIFVREISRPGADEKYIAGNIFSLRIITSVIFAAIAVGVSFFLPYEPIVRTGIMIISGFIVFTPMTQFLMGIFQKNLKLYYVSVADVLTKGVQLGLVLFLIHYKINLTGFIIAAVIIQLTYFSIVFLFSRELLRFSLRFDFDYWKKVLKISLPVAVSVVFSLIYFKIDTVLLSLMKPAEHVGIYSAAYRVLEQAIFFPAIYMGLIMPMLSRNFANGEKFSAIFNESFRHLITFAVPSVIMLFMLAPQIISLIGGAAFINSIGVLRILSFAIGIIFLGSLGGNALVALNLQKKGMWIYFSGALINLGTNFMVIPRYSYYGAAWTTILTELLVTILMFVVIYRHMQLKIKFSIVKKALLAGLLMILTLYPFKDMTLLITLPITLSYGGYLYLLKGFTKEELLQIMGRRS